jgi:adenylyltransferase/sulfurtransferase
VQAELLARAGVGHLRIIDRDFVEWSNLQRQVLFTEEDARENTPKAIAAARRLALVNSEIEIDPQVADLTAASIDDLCESGDLLIDGCDNFETRFLLNDYAVRENLPWVYSAAVGSYGLKMAVDPGRTACLRCVYPEPPSGAQPTCETEGVLGPVTAAIAALAIGDALKILTAGRTAVDTRITTLDVWSGSVRQVPASERDPDCPCCAHHEYPYLSGARRAPISLCGRNAVQIHERSRPLDLAELAQRLQAFAPVRANAFALRADLDPYELTVFPDGRAIIKGTTDTGIARSLYARYVGN